MGYQFLRDWTEKKSLDTDYMLLFKKVLKELYGEKKANKIENLVCNLAVLLDIKLDNEEKQILINSENEISEQLRLIEDNVLFTKQISIKKKEINEKIKMIDTLVNNPRLLTNEYNRRNSVLPLEQKIFSVKVFAEQLINEREKEFKKIEKLNKLLLPKNFIKYKKELKNKEKYLKLLKVNDLENEIKKLMIELQIVFLECFGKKLEYARTKLDVMHIIYEFRYYYLLFFNQESSIYEIQELQIYVNKVLRQIIDRAKEEGIIGEFSRNSEIENKIFREILSLRIINLEKIYVEMIREKETNNISMIIYDDDEFESKLILGTIGEIQKSDLGVRLNKKVKVFY